VALHLIFHSPSCKTSTVLRKKDPEQVSASQSKKKRTRKMPKRRHSTQHLKRRQKIRKM